MLNNYCLEFGLLSSLLQGKENDDSKFTHLLGCWQVAHSPDMVDAFNLSSKRQLFEPCSLSDHDICMAKMASAVYEKENCRTDNCPGSTLFDRDILKPMNFERMRSLKLVKMFVFEKVMYGP